MASKQQDKRPRLSAASTLSKPFKSPLRSREASSRSPAATPDVPVAPKEEPDPASSPTMTTVDAVPFVSPRRISHSHTAANHPRSSVQGRVPLTDPELVDLQKQQRSLQSRLSTLRNELDNAKQALRIETSNKDAELEALIIKWRLISQEAADEVFEGARERVRMMGGMAAWRERSKQDTARWAFEDEDQVAEDEDEDEEQQQQQQVGSKDSAQTKQQDQNKQDGEQDEVESIWMLLF